MKTTASNPPATKAATKAWHAENRTKVAFDLRERRKDLAAEKMAYASPFLLAACRKMSRDFRAGRNLSAAIQAIDAAIAKAS